MSRASTSATILILIAVVSLLALGFWFYYPLPQGELPQVLVSDDFPVRDDSLVSNSDRDRLEKEVLGWEKKVLGQFKELPIGSASFPDKESYRVVFIPAFDSPILVRVSRTERGFELTTKLLSGKGDYEISKLSSDEKRAMTEAEWQNLTNLLDETSFGSMPTFDRNDMPVPDGAIWLIESRRDNIFHDVVRFTPKAKFLEVCKYFLKLAGKETDYIDYLQ